MPGEEQRGAKTQANDQSTSSFPRTFCEERMLFIVLRRRGVGGFSLAGWLVALFETSFLVGPLIEGSRGASG